MNPNEHNHQLELMQMYIPMLGGSASQCYRFHCFKLIAKYAAIHSHTCLYHLDQPMRVRTCLTLTKGLYRDNWPVLTLDLDLSSLDRLADALAEAQEKVHGVEYIHLPVLVN